MRKPESRRPRVTWQEEAQRRRKESAIKLACMGGGGFAGYLLSRQLELEGISSFFAWAAGFYAGEVLGEAAKSSWDVSLPAHVRRATDSGRPDFGPPSVYPSLPRRGASR